MIKCVWKSIFKNKNHKSVLNSGISWVQTIILPPSEERIGTKMTAVRATRSFFFLSSSIVLDRSQKANPPSGTRLTWTTAALSRCVPGRGGEVSPEDRCAALRRRGRRTEGVHGNHGFVTGLSAPAGPLLSPDGHHEAPINTGRSLRWLLPSFCPNLPKVHNRLVP